MDCTES